MEYQIPYIKSSVNPYNLNRYSNLKSYTSNSYNIFQSSKGDYSSAESKIKMIQV